MPPLLAIIIATMIIVYEYVCTNGSGCIEKRTLCGTRISTHFHHETPSSFSPPKRALHPYRHRLSAIALHRQNAELDHDIASILNEYASVPLDEEIEHLTLILERCASASPQREARMSTPDEGACVSTLDEVRALRGMALRLLPGFWQVRVQLDCGIRVLEYFAKEIGMLQSMLSAFMRIHRRPG